MKHTNKMAAPIVRAISFSPPLGRERNSNPTSPTNTARPSSIAPRRKPDISAIAFPKFSLLSIGNGFFGCAHLQLSSENPCGMRADRLHFVHALAFLNGNEQCRGIVHRLRDFADMHQCEVPLSANSGSTARAADSERRTDNWMCSPFRCPVVSSQGSSQVPACKWTVATAGARPDARRRFGRSAAETRQRSLRQADIGESCAALQASPRPQPRRPAPKCRRDRDARRGRSGCNMSVRKGGHTVPPERGGRRNTMHTIGGPPVRPWTFQTDGQ